VAAFESKDSDFHAVFNIFPGYTQYPIVHYNPTRSWETLLTLYR
jgi:hypothetical protein